MANRFDRPIAHDYNMEYYIPKEFIPNFEAWDSLLGQFQKEYDTAQTVSAMVPEYLQYDEQALQEYVQSNQAEIDAVTDQFVNQGVTAGRQAQAGLLGRLKRDWQPGGKADKFQKRKAAFQAYVEKYEEQFKDAPQFMKDYAMQKLVSSITPNDIDQVIGDPNVGAYQEIFTDFMDYKKTIDPDGHTWEYVAGDWIVKETGEKVPYARVQQALNGFLSQPKYQQQLQIEAWNAARSTDKESFINQTNENIADLNETNIERLTNISQLLASSDIVDRKDGQRQLAELGLYNGDVDGLVGPITNQALKELETETNKAIIQNTKQILPDDLTDQQFMQIMQNKVINDYKQSFEATFGKTEGREIKANPFSLLAKKHWYALQRQKDYIYSLGDLVAPKLGTGVIVPDSPTPLNPTFSRVKSELGQTIQNIDDQITNLRENSVTESAFGETPTESQLMNATIAYHEATQTDNETGFDLASFRESIRQIEGFEGLDDGQIQMIQDYFDSGNYDIVAEQYNAKENALIRTKQMEKYEIGVMSKFAETKGKKDWDAFYDKHAFEGESMEDFVERTIKEAEQSGKEFSQSSYRPYGAGVSPDFGLKAKGFLERQKARLNTDMEENSADYENYVNDRYVTKEPKSPLVNFGKNLIADANNNTLFGYITEDGKDASKVLGSDGVITDWQPVPKGTEMYYRFHGKDGDGNKISIDVKIPNQEQRRKLKDLINMEFIAAVNNNDPENMEKLAEDYAIMNYDDISPMIRSKPLTARNTEKRIFIVSDTGRDVQMITTKTPDMRKNIGGQIYDIWPVMVASPQSKESSKKYIITVPSDRGHVIAKYHNGNLVSARNHVQASYTYEELMKELSMMEMLSRPDILQNVIESSVPDEMAKQMIYGQYPQSNE